MRYADDWVLAISGTREHAETLREEIAEVLSGVGLRLSPEKTLITHIDEGLDFLGWRIQRHRKRGTGKPPAFASCIFLSHWRIPRPSRSAYQHR